jgi:hypothetical protein
MVQADGRAIARPRAARAQRVRARQAHPLVYAYGVLSADREVDGLLIEGEEQVFHHIERIVAPLGLRVDESMSGCAFNSPGTSRPSGVRGFSHLIHAGGGHGHCPVGVAIVSDFGGSAVIFSREEAAWTSPRPWGSRRTRSCSGLSFVWASESCGQRRS